MSEDKIDVKDNSQQEILNTVSRKQMKHEMREERKEERHEDKERRKEEKRERKNQKKADKYEKKIEKFEEEHYEHETPNEPEQQLTIQGVPAKANARIDRLADINDSEIVSVDPSEIPDDISFSLSSVRPEDIPDDITVSFSDDEDSVDVPRKVAFNTESDLSPEIPLDEDKGVPQSTPNTRKALGVIESAYMDSDTASKEN